MHRRIAIRSMVSGGWRWGALVVCVLATGCGGSGGRTLEDEQTLSEDEHVRRFVSGVSDATGSAKAFEALFAKGAEVSESERSRSGPYMFRASSVKIVWGSATVTVIVEQAADDKAIGEVEWKCVKEGGKWRLRSAPLPAAAK